MIFNPRLMVARLMIVGYSKIVYDQSFHVGVNIIRGDNGTGKSTIMDFIFYALGGEVKGWTREAGGCDTVYCEVILNDRHFTLIRDVESRDKTKIAIFEGGVDEAVKQKNNWQVYPYSRSEHKKSFSQIIFNLLGLPYHKTEDQANLTMHQLLRLIYLDQITPPNMIFRQEDQFDSESIRAAIGDYLLGIDDLEGHRLRQELLQKNKEFDQAHAELRALYKFLGAQQVLLNTGTVMAEMSKLNANITDLRHQLDSVYEKKEQEVAAGNAGILQGLRKDIEEFGKKLVVLSEEREESVAELMDIEAFVGSLADRLSCLDESEVVQKALGDISFKHCPLCMTVISESPIGVCSLCKSDKHESGKSLGYLKMRRDIEFQIVESKKVSEKFRARLASIKAEIGKTQSELHTAKSKYQTIIHGATLYDSQSSALMFEIGITEGKINSLRDKLKIAEELDTLSEKKQELQDTINKLKDKLERLTQTRLARRNSVTGKLADTTIDLIRLDDFEPEFAEARDFDFDFGKNKTEINGRSKFSASSMVYLKNTFRLAMLLISLEDSFVRFPRFLLMDNIEDKGMQPERSHTFQLTIVDTLDTITHPKQVIFSTSMIAPELEGSGFCVGPYYKKGTHTLQI